MPINRTCDGMFRRDLLIAGGATYGGLSLPRLLAASPNPSTEASQHRGRATSAIFIELNGGPSHIDTLDPKPDAPDNIRGKFKPIATKVAGVQVSEHLPKLAGVADKIAILRGVSHTLAAHRLGQEYVATGSRPIPSLEYPAYGSVVGRQFPTARDIPTQVAVPKSSQGPGFLGLEHAAMSTNATPQAGEPFEVRGISLPGQISVEQVSQRQTLLKQLDRRFASLQDDPTVKGLDRFGRQAYDMITSPRAREAFDISREPESFQKLFGDDSFSQSCLLAVRLIESGVRFVTVQLGGWDTHQDNFTKLSENLLPKFDAGFAGLINALDQRGLLETTAVLATGEFGRTPKINDRSAEGGRDHYPRCMSMIVAGGSVAGGQVIGQSDATGSGPLHDAITPDDVAASFYWNLGIDPAMEFDSGTGRPITLVRDGTVMSQLFG